MAEAALLLGSEAGGYITGSVLVIGGGSLVKVVLIGSGDDGFPAYLLDDSNSKLPLPAIRGVGKRGAAADGMRVSNPSVTWPNR